MSLIISQPHPINPTKHSEMVRIGGSQDFDGIQGLVVLHVPEPLGLVNLTPTNARKVARALLRFAKIAAGERYKNQRKLADLESDLKTRKKGKTKSCKPTT